MIRPASIALLLTLLLPSTIYVAYSASSMSFGVLICALVWTIVDLLTGRSFLALHRTDGRRLTLLTIGIVVFSAHVAVVNLEIGGVDFVRFFSSCALLLLAFHGAQAAARMLADVSAAELIKAADKILIILTIIGVAAALGAPSIGPQASSSKPVVIFSEPSLFACAYMPMLLFRAAMSRRWGQTALLGIAFILATLLQSLTMIAGLTVVAALLLRRSALIALPLGLAIGLAGLDLAYYADRLNFSPDTDNVSTLVFLQGWQNAIMDLQASHGFGVGFQQFGIVGSTGDIADRVAALVGDYINLFDGGSTASKLVGEFGILGILAVFAFVLIAYRCAAFIRRSQRSRIGRDTRRLFFSSLIVTYSFEVFLRGSGYFTPGGFLALTALIYISGRRKHPRHSKDKPPAMSVPLAAAE